MVSETEISLKRNRPQTPSHKNREISIVLNVLTDFELPLYSLHVAVSVLSLDGVTVTHQLHKLLGQDGMLERRKRCDHFTAVFFSGSSTIKA